MDFEELSGTLSELDSIDRYRIERVMKSSAHERTELVYLIGADGSETGPFVRKAFPSGGDSGHAYSRVLAAQSSGKRFAHIPFVLDFYSKDGTNYAVMEHLEGVPLRDRPPVDMREMLIQVCDGAMELHDFQPPIIHRDIKPDNVMVCNGHAMLIDLGVSRSLREPDGEEDPNADRDTHPFATRAYAPPEQFGYGQTDERSDVYALGMLLSFCVLGRDPDPDLRAAISEGPAALETMGFSSRDAKVVAKACAFDPKERYGSVREMKADLVRPELVPSTEPAKTADPRSVNAASPVERMRATANSRYGVNQMPLPTERPYNILGVVWDVAVAVVWCFFFIVATSLIISPQECYASHPLWFRMLAYYGVIMSLFTGIGLSILDYRPIAARFKSLARLKRWQVILVSVAVFLIVCCIFGVSGNILKGAGII